MRKAICVVLLLGLSLVALLGVAGPAGAQSETFTFVCQTAGGTQTFELGKPNPNSATFTNGSTILVSAIGANISGGTAQRTAVPCTINGEGPFPFLIVR